MHKHNGKKILKTMGHCTDGCQWNNCDFWDIVTVNAANSREDVKTHVCTLFDLPMPISTGSLVICNKIYGTDYEGRP